MKNESTGGAQTQTRKLHPDVILDVNKVWKVYCRQLKRSMWYGLKDLGRQMIGAGRERTHDDLRPGEFFAVRSASFEVRKGECVAMLGPNGAGKSTMLKMVNGLIRPDAGEITIRGKTGALIELGAGFNPLLSGRENVYINAAVLGIKKAEVDQQFDAIVDFAELDEVIDAPIKTYSSGMRVRLGFSVAANLRPQLLIMDEVLAVGDVGFRMKCFAHLRKLVEQGVSIILVTHAVGMLSRVATRTVVFGKGKIVYDGDLETGIGVYEGMMTHTPKTAKLEQGEGDADAWVESVEVLNAAGQPQVEFATGDTLRLKITTDCKRDFNGARMIAALISPVHGPLFSTATPHQDVRVDLVPGGNEITLTFERIPLLIGAYFFNVSLFGSGDYEFLDRRSSQGSFRITSPPVDALGQGIHGVVEMEHRWETN